VLIRVHLRSSAAINDYFEASRGRGHKAMPQLVADMRNFHLPLPDDVYSGLRAEAERTSRPATALARQAIEQWLCHRRRVARDEAIADFAAEHAGSHWDLDTDLEIAATEHLIATEPR
jgi:predicted transcriptional regulator